MQLGLQVHDKVSTDDCLEHNCFVHPVTSLHKTAPLTRHFHWWIMAPFTNWLIDWDCDQQHEHLHKQLLELNKLYLSAWI